MRRPVLGLGSLTLLAAVLLAVPVSAQSTSAVLRPAGPMAYDVTKETTINGTVSSVLSRANAGMVVGAHLILQGRSGAVDASLGRFAFVGKDALSVKPGDSVSVTGVMQTIRGKDVFLARIVKTGSQTFSVRNERGAFVAPQARVRAAVQVNSGKKGASL